MLGFEQAPEWAEAIRRLFFADAPEQIVPPGIILADDRPEWAALRNETPFGAGVTAAASVGNFSFVAVQQAAKDRCTVVEGILLINPDTTVESYRLGIVSGTFSGQVGVPGRDSRGAKLATTTITGNQAADPFAGTQAGIFLQPQTSLWIPIPRGYILTQNSFGAANLMVANAVVNNQARAYFFGYERRLREEERAASLANP